MFIPDINTLGLLAMLFCLLSAIALMRFAFDNRRFYSLRLFAYGDLLILAGLLLYSLRMVLSPLFSLAGGNMLILLAFIVFQIGAASFLKSLFPFQWVHWFVFVLVSGGLVYIVLFNMPLMAAILLINGFILGESVYGSVQFIRSGKKGIARQKNNMSAGYLLFSLYALFRLVFAVLEYYRGDLISDEMFFAAFFIVITVFITNSAFSLTWMASAVLEEDLDKRARLDPLTGALNRRALLDELNREIARSKRRSLTFSLIMADIDHFKTINERHGYLAGDSVLMAFKTLVEGNLRINDLLSRYGEEEFMILLPDTEKKNAVETAERIRKVLESYYHPFNGQEIRFTASFGVTSFDMEARNKEELLENTEIALYEAKSKGRNRVEVK